MKLMVVRTHDTPINEYERWALTNGRPLDSIIADIEAARDKDKLCEYPYSRCIEIIRKAAGNED